MLKRCRCRRQVRPRSRGRDSLSSCCGDCPRIPPRSSAASCSALLVLMAIFAPLLLRHPIDLENMDVCDARALRATYWFGTDELGRDIFSRIVWGSRFSLSIGVLAVAVGARRLAWCLAPSPAISASGGRYHHAPDGCASIDSRHPARMIVSVVLGPGYVNTLLALAVGGIPMSVRLTRAGILGIRHQEYLEAATSINASTPRIIFRHVLPNSFSPVLVSATMSIGNIIMMAPCSASSAWVCSLPCPNGAR